MEQAEPSERPKASVYVDGFNLYNRLLKGYPEHKWLDLEALCDRVLSDYDVVAVNYFTAVIKTLPGADTDSPQRQQAYMRALQAQTRTAVFLGKFRIDRRRMPVHPTEWEPDGSPRVVTVKKTEEKGSDVALASRLLIDAMKDSADIFVVITNDSDLVMPMRLVQEELGRQGGLLSPLQPKRASNELKQTQPLWHRQITVADIAACQFPDEIPDAHGTVHRPTKWAKNSEGPAEARPPNQ